MSNVRDFGATGDGKTDDTDAIQHCIDDGDGYVEFSRGDYRITRTLTVELAKHSRTGLHGSGGTAKLIMQGPGPAIRLKGTHTTSAHPGGFRPDEWQHERMPTVSNLEIEGKHPEADGIRIESVMQPTLTGLLIRDVRTAVYVTRRARNLLISHCHIYNNTGVGIHLDKLDLHQTIITGSHVSYCRLGGIRIEASEIRNLQITGNDIEYNNNRSHKVPGADDVPTAEIYIDVSSGSVREGTIASNTIQATYSPGGANIRFLGRDKDSYKVGMWTISGNLIGSQETNVHLTSAHGVTITGNYIYSGHHRNLLVEDSREIVVSANCFGHNRDYGTQELSTGVRFDNCTNCVISGLLVQDSQAGKHTVTGAVPIVRQGLIELVGCDGLNLNGVQVLEGTPYGIYLENCSNTVITGCTVRETRPTKLMEAAIHWTGEGAGNLIGMCRIGSGLKDRITAPEHVRLSENLFDA